METSKLAALPCANPYCGVNVIMPYLLAIELLTKGIDLLCPICRERLRLDIDQNLLEE